MRPASRGKGRRRASHNDIPSAATPNSSEAIGPTNGSNSRFTSVDRSARNSSQGNTTPFSTAPPTATSHTLTVSSP